MSDVVRAIFWLCFRNMEFFGAFTSKIVQKTIHFSQRIGNLKECWKLILNYAQLHYNTSAASVMEELENKKPNLGDIASENIHQGVHFSYILVFLIIEKNPTLFRDICQVFAQQQRLFKLLITVIAIRIDLCVFTQRLGFKPVLLSANIRKAKALCRRNNNR